MRTALQRARDSLGGFGERSEERKRVTSVAASGAQRLGSLERARLHRRPGCAAQQKDCKESIQSGAPTRRRRVRFGGGAERAPRQSNFTILVTVRTKAHAQRSARP